MHKPLSIDVHEATHKRATSQCTVLKKHGGDLVDGL